MLLPPIRKGKPGIERERKKKTTEGEDCFHTKPPAHAERNAMHAFFLRNQKD